MHWLAYPHKLGQHPIGARTDEESSDLRDILGGQRTVESGVPKTIAIAQPHCTVTRSTEPRRIREHSVEHLLQLAGRACDSLQYFRRRGLLLERFTQRVEQSRVLNGDDGLRGKVLDQFDLLVGKWTDLLAVNDYGADELFVSEHWNREQCADTSGLHGANGQMIASAIDL